MAWSKFDPHAPPLDPLEAKSGSAARRAWVLRWGLWITEGMVILGFGLMLWWAFRP